jgi:hypothetical protein
MIERSLMTARAALGPRGSTEQIDIGGTLSVEDAVAEGLAVGTSPCW